MDYKNNFRIGLIIRVVLLTIFIFISIFSSYKNEWYVTTVVSAIISFMLVLAVIVYAEKYKKSLGEFLLSIKSRDLISSTRSISDKNSKGILKDAYQVIIEEFQNIRINKEVQYHYLRTIVEHIKIALLSFNEEGEIQFINQTAIKLLNIENKHSIKTIKEDNLQLYNLILRLRSGENELIKAKANNTLMHLSVYATEIKMQGNNIKLVSLQDIKQELEYQELESWQKLIRVLTHEIMNSVTPISSLSTAINETLKITEGDKSKMDKISNDDFEDIISSLQTIETRSKGLLKFVSSYKKLTRIPKPEFREVNIVELLNHCFTLFKQKLSEYHIQYQINSKGKNITTVADYDLIEQVIINLILNSIDALKGKYNPLIMVNIEKSKMNKPNILFNDNGEGIKPGDMEKIFIPFYTTKKEGSGIGLSLSQQIMHLHKGSIQVKSQHGKGTQFIINF